MKTTLKFLRQKYFNKVANLIPKTNVQFVILTHLLEDRPELLSAIQQISPISLVIGIPYSTNSATLIELSSHYKVATPNLEQLYSKPYLINLIQNNIEKTKPVIIIEIGGYFAQVLNELQTILNGQLLGIVEDTEIGHRAYEHLANQLPCSVISVARSTLKKTEDFLVGASCLFSTEHILRKNGFPIEGKRSLVLGFGKVGRGLAHALSRRYCPVDVYDINPICRIDALSEGFQTPELNHALAQAEIIYGATGKCSLNANHFKLIKDGALLVSCSSKDVEFDINFLEHHYRKQNINDKLTAYHNNGQTLYLSAQGRPINFIDGATIGPILSLVQAEIILSIKSLLDHKQSNKLLKTDLDLQKILAKIWLDIFCDSKTGHYRLNTTTENKTTNFINNLQEIANAG